MQQNPLKHTQPTFLLIMQYIVLHRYLNLSALFSRPPFLFTVNKKKSSISPVQVLHHLIYMSSVAENPTKQIQHNALQKMSKKVNQIVLTSAGVNSREKICLLIHKYFFFVIRTSPHGTFWFFWGLDI